MRARISTFVSRTVLNLPKHVLQFPSCKDGNLLLLTLNSGSHIVAWVMWKLYRLSIRSVYTISRNIRTSQVGLVFPVAPVASNIFQFVWNILDRAQHLRNTFPPYWMQFVFIQETVWGFWDTNRRYCVGKDQYWPPLHCIYFIELTQPLFRWDLK